MMESLPRQLQGWVDPRDFTVQIRHNSRDQIVGTGFLIAADKVLTCAHVLAEAIAEVPSTFALWFRGSGSLPSRGLRDVVRREREAPDRGEKRTLLRVSFVSALGEPRSWQCFGRLSQCFIDYEDDIALLELVDVDGRAFTAPHDQIATLGDGDQAEGATYLSFGYPRLAGETNFGIVQGPISRPEGAKLVAPQMQLGATSEVLPGMSGAAVLEARRRLVVGVMVETRQRKQVAWAVNCRVLTQRPFAMTLHKEPMWTRPQPWPQTDIAAAHKSATPRPNKDVPRNAPRLDARSVARKAMLAKLDAAYAGARVKVMSLIGLAGQGKTWLARQWLERIVTGPVSARPDGVFWWSFERDKPDASAFFAAALDYMMGEQGEKPEGDGVRAQFVGGMLSAPLLDSPPAGSPGRPQRMLRHLFVLDGIEAFQDQSPERYGVLTSVPIRQLLELFATDYHDSICLVTSRTSLVDLLGAPGTYAEYPLSGLTIEEGCELLASFDVTGPRSELESLVSRRNGHAQSLGWIAGFLKVEHGGDILFADRIPDGGDQAADSRKLFAFYDQQLTDAERAVLVLFSSVRGSLPKTEAARLFRQDWGAQALNEPLTALSDAEFDRLVDRLEQRQFLNADVEDKTLSLHAVVREFYMTPVNADAAAARAAAHQRLMEYFLTQTRFSDPREAEKESDLAPLIEAVHHACRAGRHDDACRLYRKRIEGDEFVLSKKFNSYENVASILRQFFPDGDTNRAPSLGSSADQHFVLRRYGVAMMNSGRLLQASAFYNRAADTAHAANDLIGELWALENIAEVCTYTGPIPESVAAAEHAVALASGIVDVEERKAELRDALSYRGWAASMAGQLEVARASFAEAENLQGAIEETTPYLSDIYGAAHADFLRRVGGEADIARAVRITMYNSARSDTENELDNQSICQRLLGDLWAAQAKVAKSPKAAAAREENARKCYDNAYRIAQRISEKNVALEALVSRGRWAARRGDVERASDDLNRALRDAERWGHRICEIDARVGLAWCAVAMGDPGIAGHAARRAFAQSAELGYHWGRRDAEEVLEVIGQRWAPHAVVDTTPTP